MDKKKIAEIWKYHCDAVKCIAEIYECVEMVHPRPHPKEKIWGKIYETAVDEQRVFMHNHMHDLP